MSEPPRRRRPLSPEERNLWEAVAKTAKPLRKKPRRTVITHAQTPAPAAAPPPAALPKKAVPIAAPKIKHAPPPPPPPAIASLGRREKSRIARGRREIDGRLDLHGMTQAEAHHRLLGFLRRMQDRDASLVLVITGKGKLGAVSERGVLRRQVPQWLALAEFRVYVSGFEEAHVAHGGEGALYVRMRRGR